MALDTLLLLDSKDSPWIEGPGWTEVGGDQFIGHSSAWAQQNDSTFLTIDFTGTGISCIGNTVDFVPWNFTSSLDGGAPEYHSMTLGGFEQLTYDWFNISGLAEGQHTLNLTVISRILALDYAAVVPSLSQDVRDKLLIVDDSSSLMKYTGNWTETYSDYLRMFKRPVTPHGGGTHVSTSIGDVLQFPFTGTEVHVYGFYDWKVFGEMRISYTIDDRPVEERIYPLNGTEPHDFLTQPNYLYYETTTTPGEHILTLNVTRITGGQRAIVDAILYKAAFDNLASMPQITVPSVGTKDTPSPGPSTSVRKSLNAGTIAGSVVGSVVGTIILIGLIILLRKLRARESKNDKDNTETAGSQMIIEPFTLPASHITMVQGTEALAARPKFEGPKQSTTSDLESSLLITNGSGIAATLTDNRVEQLERQVQQLARETAQLQSAQMPPPYQ